MGLRINTNVQSIFSQNRLKKNIETQNTSLERLSSGTRINKASDDAAGLAISEKIRSFVRGSKQNARNASDGISMIQVAEGGLNELSGILTRLRELSIQSASDTVGDVERKFTDLEFQHLTKEISRIANTTTFNNVDLINGKGKSLDFQVGVRNDMENDVISYDPQNTNVTADSLSIEGLNIQSKEDARENLMTIDSAIEKVNAGRASLGAIQNRLQSTVTNLDIQTENLTAAESRIRDADIASETAELTRSNILRTAGISVLAQANTMSADSIRLING